MTEIDLARKRGGGGGEEAATGRRNKQIIGCQSGVAMPFRGEVWLGLCVGIMVGMREQHGCLDFIFNLQQRETRRETGM